MESREKRVYRVDIRGTLRQVWEEITKTGAAQRPMFDTVLVTDLRPGSTMKYSTRDGKRTFIAGEIVEVAPPTRLAHTFRWTDLKEEPSLVTWDLAQSGPTVSVTVTHSRLARAPKTDKRISGGWPSILANLKSVIETGNVPFKMRMQLALMRLMLPLMPKPKES